MYSILEEKPDGYKRVIFLMPTKDTHFYHFVNPEKGHICPCSFQTPIEAFNDLSNYVDSGKLKRFKIAEGFYPTVKDMERHIEEFKNGK